MKRKKQGGNNGKGEREPVAKSKAGKTADKETGRSEAMKSVMKLFSKKRLVLTLMIVMNFTGAGIQIVDAPLLESLTLDDVPCYQIDNNGRIIDGDGRLRGWIRGGEVYSPGLEIKYRLSGNQLEDSN